MNRFLIILSFFLSTYSYSFNKINYLEPQPGAEYVSINNNIIIGFDKQINLTNAEMQNCISVSGNLSGFHPGTIIVCSSNKKILIKPDASFIHGERVNVILSGELIREIYPWKKEFSYCFTISSGKIPPGFIRNTYEYNPPPAVFDIPDFIQPPPLVVSVNNNPAPGFLFTTPYNGYSSLVIMNNNGSFYWYRSFVTNKLFGDFKKQPNGNLTYFNADKNTHYELSQNYDIIDSFYCGNGYTADIHELRVLNNGHALLLAYDPEIVDMSQIVQGGNPHATVIGLIIQEIDQSKNVVFQWRSWDHFAITDAQHVNLLDSVIDYVHGNAIESDNDGNIIISSRHLNEITKINRTTGDIIWRFGGSHNQFTFTNDTLRFTYQHSVRRIANGDLTLFDNGNFHTPPFSRAVEYSLNTSSMTATLVWQFRKTPDVYGFWGGYVQRLDNGNTLISWGGTRPTVTEVKPDRTIVFEGSYQQNIYTYRAYKLDWSGAPLAINIQSGLMPTAFKLSQNFPNPFNPRTEITYDIPKASQVELSVFDETGRELKKLVSGYKQPGSYKTAFDGSNYSSGLYFYRLEAGDFSQTRKMILIK